MTSQEIRLHNYIVIKTLADELYNNMLSNFALLKSKKDIILPRLMNTARKGKNDTI